MVTCYRGSESYLDNSFTDDKIDGWDERLSRVFNRGFWNGYYLGQRLGEWSHNYGSEATRRKMYVGKCTNYFSKIGVAEFLLESQELAVGDEILITGATTGAYEMWFKLSMLSYNQWNVLKKELYFPLKRMNPFVVTTNYIKW